MSIRDQIDQARVGDLRRFVAVVETGGFTTAGQKLGESAKQLSRRIAKLERAFGVRLFHRTTRRVSTTLEGQRTYEAVRTALDALDGGLDDLSCTGVSGRVRVMVPSLLVSGFVRWLGRTLPEHAELSVDLVVSDRVPDLVADGLDVAITASPGASTTVLRRRLGEVSAVLCASQNYIDRQGAPQRIEDLAEHECLRFLGDQDQRMWPLAGEGGVVMMVPVAGRLLCNDSRALLEALRAGLGVGPHLQPFEDGLVQVLPAWSMAPIDLFALVAPGRRRLARVQHVLQAAEGLVQDLTLSGSDRRTHSQRVRSKGVRPLEIV